jgi:hypothetical protein
VEGVEEEEGNDQEIVEVKTTKKDVRNPHKDVKELLILW